MPHDHGPIVYHHIVVQKLLQARLSAGLTGEAVAREMDWSHQKFMRLETGKQIISKTDLDALTRLYEIAHTPLGERITQFATLSRGKRWWDSASPPIPLAYRRYIALEYGAVRRRHIHMFTIPEMLRTTEYAKVVTSRHPAVKLLANAADIVQRRQSHIQPTTHDTFVIDESTLHRRVGKSIDPTMMVRQIDHLINRAQVDGVDLRVIPSGSCWNPAMEKDYSILSFGDIMDDITNFGFINDPYATRPAESRLIDDVQELIANIAMTPNESIELMHSIRALHS